MIAEETREAARRAARLGRIEYRDLPHVTDVAEAKAAGMPLVTKAADARARGRGGGA